MLEIILLYYILLMDSSPGDVGKATEGLQNELRRR